MFSYLMIIFVLNSFDNLQPQGVMYNVSTSTLKLIFYRAANIGIVAIIINGNIVG